MASLVLEENKDYARDCQVKFNGQFGYEILEGSWEAYHVNMLFWYISMQAKTLKIMLYIGTKKILS